MVRHGDPLTGHHGERRAPAIATVPGIAVVLAGAASGAMWACWCRDGSVFWITAMPVLCGVAAGWRAGPRIAWVLVLASSVLSGGAFAALSLGFRHVHSPRGIPW